MKQTGTTGPLKMCSKDRVMCECLSSAPLRFKKRKKHASPSKQQKSLYVLSRLSVESTPEQMRGQQAAEDISALSTTSQAIIERSKCRRSLLRLIQCERQETQRGLRCFYPFGHLYVCVRTWIYELLLTALAAKTGKNTFQKALQSKSEGFFFTCKFH